MVFNLIMFQRFSFDRMETAVANQSKQQHCIFYDR